MEKIYRGNQPDVASGWVQRCSLIDEDGVTWCIWTQPQRNGSSWVNVKVCAAATAKHKANYWFAVETEQKRVAFSRDYGLMQQNLNGVWMAVNDMLGIGSNKI